MRKPVIPDTCECCRSFSRSDSLTMHDYKKRTGWCMKRRMTTKEDNVCPFFRKAHFGRFEDVPEQGYFY